MKKIIKNKLYDTDTAKRLGEYEPNSYKSDCETLYQKRTGEFFLHGDEKIIPLKYSEAQSWAEEHLDGDDYIAIFGEPNEDAEKVSVHYLISASAAAAIKQGAAKLGITQAEYIERLAAQ